MLRQANPVDLNQLTWWQRSKRKRWFYYSLSCLAVGYDTGTYIYGFGGGSHVYSLGVLGAGALTVVTVTIAASVLASIGVLYQAYRMKKNEDMLYDQLQASLQKEAEHLALERAHYKKLQQEYEAILGEILIARSAKTKKILLLNRLNEVIADLKSMEDRLSIYEGTRKFESEIRHVQDQPINTVIRFKDNIGTLKNRVLDCYDSLSLPRPSYSPVPPKLQPESRRNSKSDLLYTALFAFISFTVTAICTSYLFATPMGWITLGLAFGLTLLYLYAYQANATIEQKISDVRTFNTAIDAQTSIVKEKLERNKQLTIALKQMKDKDEKNEQKNVIRKKIERGQSYIMRSMKSSPSRASALSELSDSPLPSPTLSRRTSDDSPAGSLPSNTKSYSPSSKFFNNNTSKSNKSITHSQSFPTLSFHQKIS